MRVIEDIQSLLLENELLIIENRVGKLSSAVVRNRMDFLGQALGNNAFSGSAANTVWREGFEFRIIGQMTAGAGDEQYAPFPRYIDQPLNIRNDFFRAGNVKLSSGQHEIFLYVNFPKDDFVLMHGFNCG